jgi:DNA-binding IclR family transcriptional regulator
MAERRNEKGRFTSDVSKEDVLEAMKVGEPYGTRELADMLTIPRRSAHKYLTELTGEDRVRKKRIDGRSVVWMKVE